jgi:hypothetical protein
MCVCVGVFTEDALFPIPPGGFNLWMEHLARPYFSALKVGPNLFDYLFGLIYYIIPELGC